MATTLRAINSLVFGVGINDCDYVVQPRTGGKKSCCPFYRCWASMLSRCYYDRTLHFQPTYVGCSVDTAWHKFTAFRSWMLRQDWESNQLDKDLLGDGKLYSEENCVFVSSAVNKFTTDRASLRGLLPIGVTRRPEGHFQASVQISGRSKYLGVFDTPREAFNAWLSAKSQLGLDLANGQRDLRVKAGLMRYVESLPNKYGQF